MSVEGWTLDKEGGATTDMVSKNLLMVMSLHIMLLVYIYQVLLI